MSLVPTKEDQAFGAGYHQASTAGGMVIDHLGKRLREVEAQRDALIKALEELSNAVFLGGLTHQNSVAWRKARSLIGAPVTIESAQVSAPQTSKNREGGS